MSEQNEIPIVALTDELDEDIQSIYVDWFERPVIHLALGGLGTVWLTPGQARKLAARLSDAADQFEREKKPAPPS